MGATRGGKFPTMHDSAHAITEESESTRDVVTASSDSDALDEVIAKTDADQLQITGHPQMRSEPRPTRSAGTRDFTQQRDQRWDMNTASKSRESCRLAVPRNNNDLFHRAPGLLAVCALKHDT